MPSKYTTGNSPIGRRIRNKNSPVSGFAQVEREIGRVQSVPSLVSRSRQLPNGTLHLPPKAQAGGGASTPWNISLRQDSEDELWYVTVGTGIAWQSYNSTEDKLILEPVPGDYANNTGVIDFPVNTEKRVQVVSGDFLCLQAKQEGDVIFRKVTSTALEEVVVGATTFHEGFYVLGKIITDTENPLSLLKIQRAESNLYIGGMCEGGYYIQGLHPV